MKSLPDNVAEFKRTPEFTEATLPPGLQKNHTTPTGTWAQINVLSGRLLYRILEPAIEEVELSETCHGVIEPAVPHEVQIIGNVRFFVAFHR